MLLCNIMMSFYYEKFSLNGDKIFKKKNYFVYKSTYYPYYFFKYYMRNLNKFENQNIRIYCYSYNLNLCLVIVAI